MGFTIEDMLLFSRDKYEMTMVAGKNGWANSISWLLMVEDTIITTSFRGKELAVTTGLGFGTTERLMELVRELDTRHAAGLVINTGYYIKEIPEEIVEYCDSHDLPLLACPWNITMSEMIKDLTVRIFLQSQTDEQITAAFIKAIEFPQHVDEYKDELASAFDVDGRFQVVLFTTNDLDSMDSMDRRRIGYRLQIYLENITHNAHFFYYDGYFVLMLNAVGDQDANEILEGFLNRAKRRMPDKELYLGIGSAVNDVTNVGVSYRRAVYAVKHAFDEGKQIVYFDELGTKRLFYSISDYLILDEMSFSVLKPIVDYDEEHNANLVETLYSYLKNGGSIQTVASELFIHKNTIVYRMGKIKELLGTELEDGEERMKYYLACELLKI